MFKIKKIYKNKRQDLIFYILMMIFPVLQFVIFYVGVNFNYILLSFQKIDILEGTQTWTFKNISLAFQLMTKSSKLINAEKLSIISYVLLTLVGTPLGLLFSYYIYKNFFGSAVFKIFLFLPSIISAIVMVTVFQFYVERAIPEIILKCFNKEIYGLLENKKTCYATILFYNLWIGFGTVILIYSNGMSGISSEIVESAQLEGAYGIKEFWYITFPLIYPTFSTFFIIGIAGIFTNQLNLFSFFGVSAPERIETLGYYLYYKTILAGSKAEYPLLSSIGLLLTCIAIPLTFMIKFLLEKTGPCFD